MDEMTCNVVPMDYIDILVGITFLDDRKGTIIPYQGKYMVSKGGDNFFIHVVLTSKASSILVNKT